MKKQNFLHGALILVFASLMVKIFGAIFKIPLTNIIGVTSMAYFNSAYGFYVIFYMISTAGIPVALSKMISEAEAKENKKEIDKIFKVSYILFLILGIVGSALMIAFSRQYAEYVKLPGLQYAIFSISITLFFMCITSAYRGYFQGLKNMTPTAVSQIIGAIGKLVIGLIVAIFATKQGFEPPMVAALTLLGITSGSIGAALYLSIYKKRCDLKDSIKIAQLSSRVSTASNLLKRLAVIAVPITLSATILSLTNTVDTTLMIRRLVTAGIEETEATKIMGAYTSMSVPLNNLPPNIIYPFTISVIPAITGMFALGKINETNKIISSTLRIAALISIPCSIGLSVFSKPIISLLYSTKETIAYDAQILTATDIAAQMLSVLATSIFFIAMVSVTNAILQAYNHEKLTIISTGVGIFIKIILNYTLIGNENISIFGASVATLACYVVIMFLNIYFITYRTDYKINSISLSMIIKPIISSVISIGCARVIYEFSSFTPKISAVISIAVAGVLYFVTIFTLKGIAEEDILMLPKGKEIVQFLKKIKFLN